MMIFYESTRVFLRHDRSGGAGYWIANISGDPHKLPGTSCKERTLILKFVCMIFLLL